MFRKILILGLLGVASSTWSQTGNEAQWRTQIQQQAEQIEQLTRQRTPLIRAGDSLAALIQPLRAKSNLNIFQRQRLESLLTESQTLTEKINGLDQHLAELETSYQAGLIQLVTWYEQQIDLSLNVLKNKKLSPEQQRLQYQKISQWQQAREIYAPRIKAATPALNFDPGLEVLETDSYQKIRQKTELLKDQMDKIQARLRVVENRTTKLKKEYELRTRLKELITDTWLFDHRNENLTQVPNAVKTETFDGNRGGTGYTGAAAPNAGYQTEIDFLLSNNLATMRALDFEIYLERLARYKKSLEKSTDSLQVKIKEFEQAATKKLQESNR